MEEKIKEKTTERRICLGPLWLYQRGQKRGTAFMTLMIRKTLSLNIIIQVKDKRDHKRTIESFMIKQIPLPGVLKIIQIADSIRKIRRRNSPHVKWEIKEYEIDNRFEKK